MKNPALLISFWFFFNLTNLNAQEFTSIEALISDTTVSEKLIPFGSISSAAEESNQVIRKVSQDLTAEDLNRSMDSTLSIYSSEIDSIFELMNEESPAASILLDIERRTIELEKYKSMLTEYNEVLQEEINVLEDDLEKIHQLNRIWENTRSAEGIDEVSQAIRLEVNSLLIGIKNTQQNLQNRINRYLEMQIKINNQLAKVQELLDQINDQREEQERNLFRRSAPPLWNYLLLKNREKPSKFDFSNLYEIIKSDILDYYSSNKTQIYLALLYLILAQVFFIYIKSLIKKAEFEDDLDKNQNSALRLLGSNWSTASVLGLIIVYFTLPDKPQIITGILFLVSLIPLYFLIYNIVEKNYHYLIRMLFVIFFLTLLLEPAMELALFRRFFLLILNILTLIWLIILLQRNWYRIFNRKLIVISEILSKTINI
jgi:hypothetical protein